jgi:hypothetical protein
VLARMLEQDIAAAKAARRNNATDDRFILGMLEQFLGA